MKIKRKFMLSTEIFLLLLSNMLRECTIITLYKTINVTALNCGRLSIVYLKTGGRQTHNTVSKFDNGDMINDERVIVNKFNHYFSNVGRLFADTIAHRQLNPMHYYG